MNRRGSASPDLDRRLSLVTVLTVVLMVSVGCQRLSQQFSLSPPPLPDLGQPIESTVYVELDPSVTRAKSQYVDSCGRIGVLHIGGQLEDHILEAAHLTFKKVIPATQHATPTDLSIRVRLLDPKFTIRTDTVYDRVPAELLLDSLVEFRDASGALVAEEPIQVVFKERLMVEPTQNRCAYLIEPFMRDAAQRYAVQFSRLARAKYEERYASTKDLATLVVKTVASDANQNTLWEGGEAVKVQVQVTNTGTTPTPTLSVSVTAPPAWGASFPTSMQPLTPLAPGETRAVEFAATVPSGVAGGPVELAVTVTDASGAASTRQTVVANVAPTQATTATAAPLPDNVDVVPPSIGLTRPQVFLVSIGLSGHRDPQIAGRPYAAGDAQLVSAYFQALGGIPSGNVRVLQDRKALRSDIDEAILDWLPPRLSPESLVIVYFSGQARVAPTGEVYLVPFDASASSTTRLYPLKDLELALTSLKARHTVLIFDGTVSRLGDPKVKSKEPQWSAGSANVVRLIGSTGFAEALESTQHRHGLFTYYLLRGLRGEADENLNGEVTLGELASFLSETVPAAAKTEWGKDQRPLIAPPLTSLPRSAGVMLTRTAAPLASSR